MMEEIKFVPLYCERVWGGRRLESVYGRDLPDAARPYGESWEVVDRAGEQSVVADGRWAGRSLHELWAGHREEIFGPGLPDAPRFPLLIKILDASDKLSIQVHPPADVAARLGGEAKTEMWYIAAAEPGAKLYVGLRKGVTRGDFEHAIAEGSVADCVHAIEPRAGESISIPSGRLHAIGGGLLIYEIQQNSDTTYRVFDWNRLGLDGKPRQLHVVESLASMDFNDFEPSMDTPKGDVLAECPHFRVARKTFADGAPVANPDPRRFSIITVVEGTLSGSGGRKYKPGDFLLLPAGSESVATDGPAVLLQTTIP
jgi:mannose-6-phosphate isomerase